jgi:hypothetical protein
MGREGPIWSVVSRLLQVPLLQEPNERRLVVRMLADYWGTPIPIHEDPHPVMHLFNIVETCLRRPNGLNVLAEMVERIDGGSRHMAGVHRVVDSMAVRELWPDDERELLFAVLEGLPAHDALDLYRLAAGPDAPELAVPATYQEALILLETLAATTDGLPRAVVFVELIANTLPSGLAAELRQWSERQVGLMGLTNELRLARRRTPLTRNALMSTKPPPHTPAYVIFLMQPEGVDGDRFRLSHWRQLDASQDWSPDREPEYTGNLADVKHRIAMLVENVEKMWARYQPDIFVEFVLPRELLNLDVEQWACGTEPEMPTPIGCQYPVAVRSLERMTKPNWYRLWHARWLALQNQLTDNRAIAVESGYWCAAGDTDSALRKIVAVLQEQADLVVLLPSEPPQAAGADEVWIGFRNGVPVMLWHRYDCRSEEFVDVVRSALHGDDSHDVRERVRRIRLRGYEAGTEARHVGSHLTLLWDDPDRKVTPDLARPPEQVAL